MPILPWKMSTFKKVNKQKMTKIQKNKVTKMKWARKKFIYSDKTTKYVKSSFLIWRLLCKVQINCEILFLWAFSEFRNFKAAMISRDIFSKLQFFYQRKYLVKSKVLYLVFNCNFIKRFGPAKCNKIKAPWNYWVWILLKLN